MSDKNSSPAKARFIATGYMLLILAATSSFCTQYVAGRLAYHPSLGTPLYGQIYNPAAWLGWSFKYFNQATEIFQTAYLIFAAGAIVSLIVASLIFGFKARSSRKHEGVHGTAAFATAEQVRKSGLLPKPGKVGAGVYCGGFDDPETGRTEYLRHNGPEHICVLAPTRSGKGVGIVIPTLLSWEHSAFIYDPKMELWAATAGYRSQHGIVLCFDPADPLSCGWNPLQEIRFGTHKQTSDTQNIALMMIDADGAGLFDHWRKGAHQMLVGIILHALYKSAAVGQVPGLLDILEMLLGQVALGGEKPEITFDDGDIRPLAALLQEMKEVTLDETDPVAVHAQRIIRGIGQRFGETPPKELSGYISTTTNSMSIYFDEDVAKNTSHSDFKVSDLMDHDRPVSLYFITTPDDNARMKPLARLLLTRILSSLCGRMEFVKGRPKTTHKHRLLLMLDEFPSLGKLDVLQSSLAFIGGYGIKAVLITQDTEQLYQVYTKHESIISNCHIRIAYAPNKLETAEWLSKMAGETTVIKEQISTSGNRFGPGPMKNVSRSYQEVRRPLMTPDEVQRLPGAEKDEDGDITKAGEMLIFVAGQPVIRGRQILYFLDPTFSKRSMIAPPEKSDVVRST